jgi:two-component system, NarL family, response regulator DevR
LNKVLNVFIADDSAVVRDRLAELIAQVGGLRVVGQADDAPSAEDGILTTKPDVAIVDIRMPGGSGIDVVRRVRETAENKPTFIVHSNYAYDQFRKACADAGADFFFEKGTETHRVSDALRMLATR